MKGLITDRTQANVYYRSELSAKGLAGMTETEKADWFGDPMKAVGANLLPFGPYYSSVVGLRYTNDAITATSLSSGTYLYAVSIVGEAVNFENKILTLSVDSIETTGSGTPQLAAWWHDDNGNEYAGAGLTSPGSATFNTAEWPNAGNRKYLALYVYVTTDANVSAGSAVRFGGVMLENGEIKHEYVPYTEILPTDCTKGAYNYSDLNRVERAVAEISDIAGLNLITKTNWAMRDIPKESDMERYLNNIRLIRERYSVDIELPSTMSGLTYNYANNIEKILLVAYDVATAM